MTKRILIISSIIVFFFVAIYLLIARFDNRFFIENRTQKTIARVQVDVCQLTYTFSNIAPGEVVWANHKVVGDSHYTVSGNLQNGTKIFGSDGYVSNGYMGMRDLLVVQPSGKVEIKQSKIFP